MSVLLNLSKRRVHFMQNPFIAYINGEYVSQNQAKISILDLGLTRGYGVFDFFRTYQGIPFCFEDHFIRLKNSAKTLNLNFPITQEKLKTIIFSLIKKNKQKEAAIKVILTGGETFHSFELNENPTFIVTTLPLPVYPKEYFTDGIKIISKEHHPFLAECKTLNYIPALIAMQEAGLLDAKEVLFTYNNRILECGTSNFFAFKDNTLITPSRDIIFGITRKAILKIANGHFNIEERDINKDEINTFDEVFISASNKEIWPVRQIDENLIRDGKVGQNTKKMMVLFKIYTENLLWLEENVGAINS